MTYVKPSNITYTEMCIWIDTNAYTDTCDDIKLYEYLYHLVNMLSHESKYFNKIDYYDDFSLYSASKLFMRLKNSKQFEYTEEGLPKLTRIKSILNYIKTVLYPYKVDYEQEYYSQSQDDIEVLVENNFDFAEYLSEECKIFSNIDFKLSLGGIKNTIKSFLNKIPRKRNDPEWYNIYLSCLLTILNSITASKEQLGEVEEDDDLIRIDHLYSLLRTKDPILYHLDLSYTNCIKTLVVEIRHLLTKELMVELHSYIPAELALKNVMISSLEEGTENGDN